MSYVLPTVYGEWDIRSRLFGKQAAASVSSRIKASFSEVKLNDFKVLNIDPTSKDGGVFVNFTYKLGGDNTPAKALEEIEQALREKTEKEGGIRPWSGIGQGVFYRVKGKPWNEVGPRSVLRLEK